MSFVVGGGFRGELRRSRPLYRTNCRITLIDRRNHNLFPAAALSGGDRGAFSCGYRGSHQECHAWGSGMSVSVSQPFTAVGRSSETRAHRGGNASPLIS